MENENALFKPLKKSVRGTGIFFGLETVGILLVIFNHGFIGILLMYVTLAVFLLYTDFIRQGHPHV